MGQHVQEAFSVHVFIKLEVCSVFSWEMIVRTCITSGCVSLLTYVLSVIWFVVQHTANSVAVISHRVRDVADQISSCFSLISATLLKCIHYILLKNFRGSAAKKWGGAEHILCPSIGWQRILTSNVSSSQQNLCAGRNDFSVLFWLISEMYAIEKKVISCLSCVSLPVC